MIWVILIIMLVILIAGIFYEGFLMLIYPIYDFFFHTRWGLFAIISFLLSFFFGFASKKTHEDVKIKDEIMDSLKIFISDISNVFLNKRSNKVLSINYNENNMKKINSGSLKNYDKGEYVIDMSKTNIDGVLKSFAKSLNQPMPIILKGWSNNRIRLDVQRVNILIEYAKSIRNLGNEFLELQADAIFSHKKLEFFLEKRENESQNEINLLKQEAEDLRDKYLNIKEQRKQAIELLKTKVDRDKTLVEREKVINDLIIKANNNWDNLTPEQRDIILSITNPKASLDTSNDSLDKDLNEMDILLKQQDVIAKQIENKKSEIERKQMNDKYRENKNK